MVPRIAILLSNNFEFFSVCHLAGKFVKILQRQQPELCITDEEVLCVEIAALCHDLGHGPFSHFWECFLNRIKPEDKWKVTIVISGMDD